MKQPHVDPVLLRAALKSAVDAVLLAAAHATKNADRLAPRRMRRKGPGDFVTAIDEQCEQKMRRILRRGVREAGFVGEEGGADDANRELCWVVDPIDGTSNYARGLPQWAVAAALVANGSPVVSAIWSEPESALYTAVLGEGALRNGSPMSRPKPCWDDRSVVGCQWRIGQRDLAFLSALQQRGARIRTYGSTIVQMLDVACGRLDANIQELGRPWDLAAASLVLQELGGKVTGWSGKPLFPMDDLANGDHASVAAMPSVHRKALALLDKFRAVVPPR